ncbi:MAG TPA: ABC transporter permease [Methylomirabilota bacterium]|jgi:peptide/nickel transport system permease protein|nr:ABC transporter permease [Methylomirabilota bacterium]
MSAVGDVAVPALVPRRPRADTLLGDAWRRFRRSRLALLGLLIVGALVATAVLAPWLAPGDPGKQSLVEKRAKPGGKYLLGADEFGRDILSRVIYGTRVALLVGGLSVAIALALGLLLGSVAGFAGGVADAVIMRAVEVLLAFPYLLLAIAVVSALGPGPVNTTIAVGIWGAPPVTRIVRGSVLGLKETEYVRAARALGAGSFALIARHILPNVLPTVIVYATLFMANAILVEAALSFLGLGVQPPTPSWGLMVSTGRDLLLVAPHVATIPGLAIMVAVLGFNLLGDGFRDALDPRLRGV